MNNDSFEFRVNKLKKNIKNPGLAMEDNLTELESLLELSPVSTELLCMKADLHYELAAVTDMSHKEKPIDLYKQALAIDKDNYEVVTKLAIYLSVVLEDYSDSLDYFAKSVNLRSDEDVYLLYAEALANLERPNEAIEIVKGSELDGDAIQRIVQDITEEYL